MNTDDLVRELHDKATRGVLLSVEEQSQLEHWYALQDQAESDALAQVSPPPAKAVLRTQVDAAVAQLAAVTHRIQAAAAENEAVRRENDALRQRLAQRPTTQPA
jgi:hypothetical protein